MTTVCPSRFNIRVGVDVLQDLQERLKKTRWCYQIEGTGWDSGTDVDYLKVLIIGRTVTTGARTNGGSINLRISKPT